MDTHDVALATLAYFRRHRVPRNRGLPLPELNQLGPDGWACSWCGCFADNDALGTGSMAPDGLPRWVSRHGEVFCCRKCRDASNRALRRFLAF